MIKFKFLKISIRNMNIFEIRIHGRGGQGVKSAGELVAECALEKGKYVQAFPEYGPERAGAPINAYIKISDKRIKSYTPLKEPNVAIVVDPGVVYLPETISGLCEKCILITNSQKSPEEIREKIKFKGKIYALDATKIALKYLKVDKPNTAMLGALIKVTKVIDIETLNKKIEEMFLKKLGKELTEANKKVVKEGYDWVR